MFKYQLSLVLSCLFAAILFSWVRLRPTPHEPTTALVGAKPNTVFPTPGCLNEPPYTVVHDWASSTFTLCQGGYTDDIPVTCPNRTKYNPTQKRCDPVDPCMWYPDGALIEATTAVHLPQNRRYHVCFGRQIQSTHVCPDEKPYFDGVLCVASDACSYLSEGTTYADPQDPTSYIRCKNKLPEPHTCPPGYHFSVTHCVARDICEGKPEGDKFQDITDPTAFYECHQTRARKRKCGPNERFSAFKRQCISYNQCAGKPNTWIPVDTLYLKRSHEVIVCDSHALLRRDYCSDPLHVFDEQIKACRAVDECLDLKPNKLFPQNEFSFTSCQFKNPQLVDITLKMDLHTGESISRCSGQPDGTLLGIHTFPLPDLTQLDKYVECQQQQALLRQCPRHHVFIKGACQFQPCVFEPSVMCGPYLNDPTSFYFCQKNILYTFRVICPPGLRVSAQYNTCVPDLTYTSPLPLPRPKIESQFSYTDAHGARYSCRAPDRTILDSQGQRIPVTRLLNPWTFKCQDGPCISSLTQGFSLSPISPNRGALCVGGNVVTVFDCPSQYVNLKLAWTGDFTQNLCSPTDLFNHTDTLLVLHQHTPLFLSKSQSGMISEDSFDKPIQPVEPVHAGLESIVGLLPKPSKSMTKPRCNKNDQKLMIVGYPHKQYNCKLNQFDTCNNDEIFLSWKCHKVKFFPVYGNCNLFCLGTRPLAKSYRRIFKCPSHRPLFNYSTQRCEVSPPQSQLWCEQFFFANWELVADPTNEFKLPEPVDFNP